MTDTTRETDIKKLNSFLRGELAAVETYGQCAEKIKDASIVRQLKELQASHQVRAGLLDARVRGLGGTPEKNSGVWGSFAKLAEGGAKLLGTSAAISMVEEGEDHGNKMYRDLDELSTESREFVVQNLIPDQQRSHDIMSHLQQRVP